MLGIVSVGLEIPTCKRGGALWALCNKKNYDRKLQMIVISQSVCPWQAFLAYYNDYAYDQEPT